MKMNWKNMLTVAMMATVAMSVTSCDDDDNDDELSAKEKTLQVVNSNFVENTLQPTYEGLVEATGKMIENIEAKDYAAAATSWKEARKYWEWSEAFLFGAASTYGIDPHIDTWPFEAASFENYMSRYNPATNESDAALLEEAIATGRNLTGFHAVEYLLFRNGAVRTNLTDDEAWFAQAAAEDLYLNACKLVSAWNGDLTKDQEALLEEAEFEADAFGDEFKDAGFAGSRWKTVTAATVEIIEGCQKIIDEVAHSKIGAPYTGEDETYIESPHAYNSITDFYDNIMSVKNSLYGLTPSDNNKGITAPAVGSLITYSLVSAPTQTAKVTAALEAALLAIDNMPKPFVQNYKDAKVGLAIEALEALNSTLNDLKNAIGE